MGDDDEPAYGSNELSDEDGQYGGTGDGGDDKRSAGAEEGEIEGDDSDDSDEDGDEEALGQDETDPE